MERFAIKIDKSLKLSLSNLCRLCGIDKPDKVPILDPAAWNALNGIVDADSEPELCRKIYECVGIEVLKGDRMPSCICMACSEKLGDFYEFREMCKATNVQTRKLLGLPPEPTKAPAKGKKNLQQIIEGVNEAESIFGVVGDEAKLEDTGNRKKSKKVPKTTLIRTKNGKVRRMTKKEQEIAVELERIKNEEEMEMKMKMEEPELPPIRSRKKGKANAGAPLLTLKEPNKREKMREIEQKKQDKKRKRNVEPKTPAPIAKKIKKETSIICNICAEQFTTAQLHTDHLVTKHLPRIWEFGCSSCSEQFSTDEENKLHHDWHKMFTIAYKCPLCAEEYDRMLSFQRHVSICTDHIFESIQQTENIFCKKCKSEYITQNLYDWHGCFIKNNGHCPKCKRVFTKKTILFKHLFKCTNLPVLSKDQIVVLIPRSKSGRIRSNKRSASNYSIKAEPEAILESVGTDELVNDATDDHFQDSFGDTHFGDDNDSDSDKEPSAGPSTSNASKPSTSKQISKTTVTAKKRQCKGISKLDSLLPCHVKIEPIDISEFRNTGTIQPNAAKKPVEPEVQPPRTVQQRPPSPKPIQEKVQPPKLKQPEVSTSVPAQQAIVPLVQIKKEKIHPGYGDVVFDPVLARNIKKERGQDQSPAKQQIDAINKQPPMPSTSEIVSESEKPKLYKKPALLAIKIKQERIERELHDPVDNSHSDLSVYMNNEDYDTSLPHLAALPATDDVTLPVIAGICSAAEMNENIQIPVISNVLTGADLAPISVGVPAIRPTSSIPPFKIIRIKEEPKDTPPELDEIQSSIDGDAVTEPETVVDHSFNYQTEEPIPHLAEPNEKAFDNLLALTNATNPSDVNSYDPPISTAELGNGNISNPSSDIPFISNENQPRDEASLNKNDDSPAFGNDKLFDAIRQGERDKTLESVPHRIESKEEISESVPLASVSENIALQLEQTVQNTSIEQNETKTVPETAHKNQEKKKKVVTFNLDCEKNLEFHEQSLLQPCEEKLGSVENNEKEEVTLNEKKLEEIENELLNSPDDNETEQTDDDFSEETLKQLEKLTEASDDNEQNEIEENGNGEENDEILEKLQENLTISGNQNENKKSDGHDDSSSNELEGLEATKEELSNSSTEKEENADIIEERIEEEEEDKNELQNEIKIKYDQELSIEKSSEEREKKIIEASDYDSTWVRLEQENIKNDNGISSNEVDSHKSNEEQSECLYKEAVKIDIVTSAVGALSNDSTLNLLFDEFATDITTNLDQVLIENSAGAASSTITNTVSNDLGSEVGSNKTEIPNNPPASTENNENKVDKAVNELHLSDGELKIQLQLNANESASMQQTASLLKMTNDVLELDEISDTSLGFDEF